MSNKKNGIVLVLLLVAVGGALMYFGQPDMGAPVESKETSASNNPPSTGTTNEAKNTTESNQAKKVEETATPTSLASDPSAVASF